MKRLLTLPTRLKPLKSLTLVAFALSLGACATTVSSTVDRSDQADLDGFTTYAWLGDDMTLGNTSHPNVINPLNASRIRAAINDELATKGYKQVGADTADFIVSASVGANDRIKVREYYDNLGYQYGSYSRFGGFGSRFGSFGPRFGNFGLNRQVSVDTYTEGVLVLNVFETRTKEAVWHGAATKRLTKKYTTPKLIDEAVMTLLEQFPDHMSTSMKRADIMT